MKFKVLSHACLLISTEKTSIVIDPWLLGSCYWRSWWNFPEASFEEEELRNVDAVIISHIHWDHWHGPTLKKFFLGKPVFVPDEPGLRSEKDLRSIGFDRVTRLPHGKTYLVGDIKITLYQFGLALNDAAIVVEADGVAILNANDAKIAGLPLENLVSRHGPFKFAFRSHSSANARICYKIEGEEGYVSDDREHYFRSFAAFMDRVKPEFAIPFASNHCHLHDDVFSLNSYISNPLQLRTYVENLPSPPKWKLQVMLPGSIWSEREEFILRDESCYENLAEELAAYRVRADQKLAKYRQYEQQVLISENILARFLKFFDVKRLPEFCKNAFLLSLRWPDGTVRTLEISPHILGFKDVEPSEHSKEGLPMIIMPAVVFRDAVIKNMFHHASISKRCKYLAQSTNDLHRLEKIVSLLEKTELGFFPLSLAYSRRLFRGYIRRWRELLVYGHALWLLKIRRHPIYVTEEAILRGKM